jgi:hypothetical protein
LEIIAEGWLEEASDSALAWKAISAASGLDSYASTSGILDKTEALPPVFSLMLEIPACSRDDIHFWTGRQSE